MATLTITFEDQVITDEMWLAITQLKNVTIEYDGDEFENAKCANHINEMNEAKEVKEVKESIEFRSVEEVITEIKRVVNELDTDEEKYSFLMESDASLRTFFDKKENEIISEAFDIDAVKPSYRRKYKEYKGINGRKSWEDVYSGREEEIMEYFLYLLMPQHDYSKCTKSSKMITTYPNKAAFKAAGFVHFF